MHSVLFCNISVLFEMFFITFQSKMGWLYKSQSSIHMFLVFNLI